MTPAHLFSGADIRSQYHNIAVKQFCYNQTSSFARREGISRELVAAMPSRVFSCQVSGSGSAW